jgi:peptidoglycan L-alanyl-D-glutamate endopeptidase CwlK
MTDRNLDDLHPDLKPLCQQWLDQCQAQQIHAEVICTYRSAQQQDADWRIGRDANGKIIGKVITNARGGQSQHNITLDDGTAASKAFDWVIIKSDGTCNWNPDSPEWKAAVAIGKQLGLTWGGDWNSIKDYDHFEIA